MCVCVCVAAVLPAECSKGRNSAASARERADEKQQRDAVFGGSMKQSSCVRNLGPNMWLFSGFNGESVSHAVVCCQVLGDVRRQI